MASIKIISLAVRTLAKPIATQIKVQAGEHESFRNLCIGLAQRMHRTEARMRMGLLNEEAKNIKPLNDAKAVQNGASTLAETFLFSVAVALLLGETYRSSSKEGKRRDMVQERLENLENELNRTRDEENDAVVQLQNRSEALERALSTVVSNGLRAGWLDLGHSDGEVMSLIRQLPGGPLAFRGGEPGNAADLEVGGASPSTVTEATEPRIVAAVVSNDTLPTAPSAPASE